MDSKYTPVALYKLVMDTIEYIAICCFAMDHLIQLLRYYRCCMVLAGGRSRICFECAYASHIYSTSHFSNRA